MAESIHEQAIAAIKARMEAIVGDDGSTYWYTPDVVERTATVEYEAMLNERFETIYLLAPDEEENVEKTGGEATENYTFGFLLARVFKQTEEPYQQATPLRWTVQTRLARDFKRALWLDVTLDKLVTNVNINRISYRSDETNVSGWAIVIGECEIVADVRVNAP